MYCTEKYDIFKFTFSCEKEHNALLRFYCYAYFNPLPHTRENQQLYCRSHLCKNFNPLPHTRENATAQFFKAVRRFQSTPSYEGEHFDSKISDDKKLFQSTPSYEENQLISIHSLVRGRTNPLTATIPSRGFQSTPS